MSTSEAEEFRGQAADGWRLWCRSLVGDCLDGRGPPGRQRSALKLLFSCEIHPVVRFSFSGMNLASRGLL